MRMYLHIADHFDTLASGKVLAVGLFPDRVLLIQVPAERQDPSPDAPYGANLGLLVTLSEGPGGPVSGDIKVLPPAGLPAVATLAIPELVASDGRSANIIGMLRPLLVPRAGLYTVQATLGGEVASGEFEVRIVRADLSPAGSAIDAPTPRDSRSAVRRPRLKRVPK